MGMNDDRTFNSNILLPIPLNDSYSLRRAFTFTELLALVAIIAIFSFTLLPVLSKAKMDFKVHNAKTNLSGFLRGLQFYQAQNNQEIDFGDPVAMGLPPDGISFMRFVHDYTGDYTYGFTHYDNFLPCGRLVGPYQNYVGIGYMMFDRSAFDNWIHVYQENTVILFDANCNPPGTRLNSSNDMVRAIGITLAGEIRDRSQDGNQYGMDPHFYSKHYTH